MALVSRLQNFETLSPGLGAHPRGGSTGAPVKPVAPPWNSPGIFCPAIWASEAARVCRTVSCLLGICLLVFSLPGLSRADVNTGITGLFDVTGAQAGSPVFSFLKLPVSARGVGLGYSPITTDEEATMVQTNPAGLGQVHDYFYSLTHEEILSEFRHENLALTLPTERFGTFGGAANILSATAFEGARDINETPAAPTAYDMALSAAYGTALMDGNFLAGARLDYLRSTLDGAVANGYGLNAALLFFLVQNLTLGVTLNNLSHGARYDEQASPLEPLPFSLGVELGKPLLDTRWSGQVGLVQSNEGILRYYGGAELRILKYLVLRAGYEGSAQDRQLGDWTGMAAGIGIKYDRFTFDYGYKAMGYLGGYHAFTVNYSQQAKLRPRDEVYLAQALDKYHQGKYASALRLARAAIAVNPYNFKAQALATQLQLEIDRLDEMAVTLVFTANTDGMAASEWVNGKAIGGLARRKTKLLELKGAGGKTLILDAGNLTNPAALTGAHAGVEKWIYGAYAQMPYDAINVGGAELSIGAERWKGELPWMGSQKPLPDIHRGMLSEITLKLKFDHEVIVLGALDPVGARSDALGGKELENTAAAIHRRVEGVKDGRLVILLYHGSAQSAVALAARAPELNAILLSGEGLALGSPMKAGNTLICSPGRGGTHIGLLTFTLTRAGTIKNYRHALVPLDGSIPEDPELAKFLSPITVDPNKLNLSDYDDDYRAQLLAFVNADATGQGGDLFIRDLHNGRDYPIPAGDLLCSRPILGFGKNKIAFAGEDSLGVREVYAFEPGIGRLDTLTHLGGRAEELHWIIGNNALLALYNVNGKRDVYRIDPWSRGVRNLSRGRFGDVRGFDMTRAGDRMAVHGFDGKQSRLWVAGAELDAPLEFAGDKRILGSPRWNATGDKVAFLVQSEADRPNDTVPNDAALGNAQGTPAATQGVAYQISDSLTPPGELRVFDFTEKKLIAVTERSRVRSFAWSPDGKRVFYSAGVNFADLNVFHVDSMSLSKLTQPALSPRSEEFPTPKMLGDRPGLLFESAHEDKRNILWLDLGDKSEHLLVDSAGVNSLR